jgi:hypothetical protein
MHQYRLDDKSMDQEFLAGKPVKGRALLPAHARGITPGDAVLVILSSGKKYKGKVTNYNFFVLDDNKIGEIEITRV